MRGSKPVKLGVSTIDVGILEENNWYHNVNSSNATIIATSKPNNELVPITLKRDTTEYDVLRMKPQEYQGESAVAAINHMLLLEDLLINGKIDNVVLMPGGIRQAIIGEDWFAYSEDGISWKCKVINGISAKRNKLAHDEMNKCLSCLGITTTKSRTDNLSNTLSPINNDLNISENIGNIKHGGIGSIKR